MQVRWNSSRGRLAMFNLPQLRTTVLPTELRTTSLQLTFSPFFSHQTMPTNENCGTREAQSLRMCISSTMCILPLYNMSGKNMILLYEWRPFV